jgi:hypothetical protein
MGKGHELHWGGLAGLGAVVLAVTAPSRKGAQHEHR